MNSVIIKTLPGLLVLLFMQSAAAADRHISDRPLSFFDSSRILPQSLKTDATAKRVSFVMQLGSKQRVVVDGDSGPGFNGIGSGDPEFSQDGQRMAYTAISERGQQMIIDGEKQPVYDAIGRPPHLFSPDGRQFAYAAQVNEQQFVLLNNQPQLRFDGISTASIQFSADSGQLAYIASSGGQQAAVVNGEAILWHAGIGRGTLQFSPDSRRLAYVALEENAHSLIVDGQVQKSFEGIIGGSLHFSPDSRRLLCIAVSAGKQQVVVDGEIQAAFDAVFLPAKPFSPDSRKVVYVAEKQGRQFLIVNGNQSRLYDAVGLETINFSPDSRQVAYAARKYERSYVNIDGNEFGPYDGVGTGPIIFSPDSAHTAFAAQQQDRHFVVLDGVPGPNFDGIGRGSITFSPDSQHLVYAVQEGEDFRVIVDGVQLLPTQNLLSSRLLITEDNHIIYPIQTEKGQTITVNGRPGRYCDLLLLQGGGIVLDGPQAFHYIALNGNIISAVREEITMPAPNWPGLPRHVSAKESKLLPAPPDRTVVPESDLQAGLVAEIERNINALADAANRNPLLMQLASLHAEQTNFAAALETADRITDNFSRLASRIDILAAMGVLSSATVHWKTLTAAVARLDQPLQQADLLLRLSLVAAKSESSEAAEFLQQASQLLLEMNDSDLRIPRSMFAAVHDFHQNGRTEMAQRAVEVILTLISRQDDLFRKSQDTAKLAAAMAAVDRKQSSRLFQTAQKHAAAVETQASAALALAFVAQKCRQVENHKTADELIQRILKLVAPLPDVARCPGLLEVAEIQILAGHLPEANQVLTEATVSARNLADAHYKAWCFYRIGSCYLSMKRLPEAEGAAAGIVEEKTSYKTLMLAELAHAHALAGNQSRSEELRKQTFQRLHSITDPELRVITLLEIMRKLPVSERTY